MAIYERICRTCGRYFKGGPRAWYCPDCRKERVRERAAKRSKVPRRKLGSTDLCEHCGAEYIVESGLQRYCKECQPIMHAELDRRQSLQYYNEHKEEINPKRNAARRVPMRKCVVCGALYQPHSKQITCSPACKADLRRSLSVHIYDKRRRWKIKHKNGED